MFPLWYKIFLFKGMSLWKLFRISNIQDASTIIDRFQKEKNGLKVPLRKDRIKDRKKHPGCHFWVSPEMSGRLISLIYALIWCCQIWFESLLVHFLDCPETLYLCGFRGFLFLPFGCQFGLFGCHFFNEVTPGFFSPIFSN